MSALGPVRRRGVVIGSPGDSYHSGELAVQARAGVAGNAARLVGMLALPNLDGGASLFLRDQQFIAFTSRDRDGRLWTSMLFGKPGFLTAGGRTLTVGVLPTATDPLAGLAAGPPIGMIAIDFARRRRVRINGLVDRVDSESFTVLADQAFGNCPQYIHRRHLERALQSPSESVQRGRELTDGQQAWIRAVDTFFLGSTHPTRGSDASHRGGPKGFVSADSHMLSWQDAPGNNMFTSLGNVIVDPEVSLLFLNFHTGALLHISGRAALIWPEDRGGRLEQALPRVNVEVEAVVERPGTVVEESDDW
jgi:predicted pyridoxine 5'-phosphate oxidase superfamily flavin-nucleotide-binding protein